MKLLRWDNDEVIFEYDCETIKELVEKAVKQKVSLFRANLREADLREANLYGANLYEANLYGADLFGAKGVVSFQAGEYNRTCIGYFKEIPMFNIGCFKGTKEESIEAIRKKYGIGSSYEKLIEIYSEILIKMKKDK